jgi:hypothetical protein
VNATEITASGQRGRLHPRGSGRDARATLGPTILQDRPTRPGLHARAEAVLALPTARVRLESSLGHGVLIDRADPPPSATAFSTSRILRSVWGFGEYSGKPRLPLWVNERAAAKRE